MDSHDVRRVWRDRTGEYSPAYYAYYGSDETSVAVRQVLDRFVGTDAAILEVGCSSGRHLAHLYRHGFDDLTGVDVNGDAFDVMAETYPELAATGTFHHDTIEAAITGFDDDRFDAVYSVETLQHLHHDAEWVFAELARVTSDLLVTVENEGDRNDAASRSAAPTASGTTDQSVSYVHDDLPLYHRDWDAIFTELGFEAIAADALVTDEPTGDASPAECSTPSRDTLRAFRAP